MKMVMQGRCLWIFLMHLTALIMLYFLLSSMHTVSAEVHLHSFITTILDLHDFKHHLVRHHRLPMIYKRIASVTLIKKFQYQTVLAKSLGHFVYF